MISRRASAVAPSAPTIAPSRSPCGAGSTYRCAMPGASGTRFYPASRSRPRRLGPCGDVERREAPDHAGVDDGRRLAEWRVVVAELEVDPLARVERWPLISHLPHAVDPGIEEPARAGRPLHVVDEVVPLVPDDWADGRFVHGRIELVAVGDLEA